MKLLLYTIFCLGIGGILSNPAVQGFKGGFVGDVAGSIAAPAITGAVTGLFE